MSTEPEVTEDGRNPDWPADSLELAIWLALNGPDAPPLSAIEMARARLALDSLYDSRRLLAIADSTGSARDQVAALAGARAARKAVDTLLADLLRPAKGKPGPARKPHDQRHGHRRYADEPTTRGRDRTRAFQGGAFDDDDDFDYDEWDGDR
jgi:hypothetical protein